MIESCLLFMASFTALEIPAMDTYLATDETPAVIEAVKDCNDNMPSRMIPLVEYYILFFEEENRYTAFRIGWCESRGVTSAFREEDQDSGVMQFIPRTWQWVHEVFGVPAWDDWDILRYGRPHLETDKVYKTDIGFEHLKVQNSPYWNIKAAAHLAEDMYKKTRWDDWSSSKWCWGDAEKWEKMWRKESRG